MSQIRFAVITVSDTAATDALTDKSGPAIIHVLTTRKGYTCVEDKCHIVSDDVEPIQEFVKGAVNVVDLLLTTGGTGFGKRDVTPEAISPLIERAAPGLVHLLLAASLKHTPLAALSRPVAGTIGSTLVVTLPGSVKAVNENIEALLSGGVLDHALDLIMGGTGKGVHAMLAATSPVKQDSPVESHRQHHHHHHHGDHHTPQPRSLLSHDPSAPASARHRKSPYPIISLEDALGIINERIVPLRTEQRPVNHLLAGYVLAEDVYAPQNIPFTSTTSVDGYALRSTDPPGVYTVLTPNTHALTQTLPPGSIFRINTGGSLPAGADTVIMVEDTHLVSTFQGADGTEGEEKEVEILVQVPPQDNVRAPGSDVKQGDLVLHKGERILSSGGEVGTLSFVGRKEVSVFRKPIVAILSTGNEIVDLHTSSQSSDEPAGIFDTNRPALQAALVGLGYEVIDLGIVPDDVQAHVDAIQKGLQHADILLTTGGTSMGPTDLLKPVIERNFNGTVHFGRVSVKPGKPTTFATIPNTAGTITPIFALPGNPASALVTFYVFVVPALRRMGGWPGNSCYLPRVPVQLQDAMILDPRTEFHRVIIKASTDGLKAFSTGGQRSSKAGSLKGANGLVVLPQRASPGPSRLEVGASAEAIVIGEIQML